MGLIRHSLAIAIGLLVVLAYTPAAGAQSAPPDSEFDQYVPAVPEVEQDTPVRDKKERGRGSKGDGTVPDPVGEELQERSPTGEAAAEAAEATSPDDNKGSKKDEESGDSSSREGDASSAAALAGTVAGSDSEGGMGILLPLIIIGAIGAGVAYVVVRRRIAGGDSGRAGDG